LCFWEGDRLLRLDGDPDVLRFWEGDRLLLLGGDANLLRFWEGDGLLRLGDCDPLCFVVEADRIDRILRVEAEDDRVGLGAPVGGEIESDSSPPEDFESSLSVFSVDTDLGFSFGLTTSFFFIGCF